MDIFKLAKDSRGNYRRDLGWEKDGQKLRQHRFYVGKDRAMAAIRVQRLESLWAAVERRWAATPETPRPLWDATTLAIAGAICRGQESIEIETETATGWADLLHWFGSCGVRLDVQQQHAQAIHEETEQATATLRQVQATMAAMDNRTEAAIAERRSRGIGSQTLYQALDAYSAYLARTMLLPDGTGRPSPSCKLWQRQVRQIREHTKDMPLGLFNLDALDGMISFWASRPVLPRTKRPASPDTARDNIKRIRTFVKWLHKSSEFKWRKPDDYETGRVRIRLTPQETSERQTPDRVQTYTLEELGTLWEYASPWEHLLMVLALNCGFGVDQLSMLQTGEIHEPDNRHPAPWIGRTRFKTGVYSEWVLWPQTTAAIKWMERRREGSKEPFLILSRNGKPLTLTSGSNRCQAIPNAWASLNRRIKKDVAFKKLSFNKLRKTAIDLIRRLSDGETAGVFASHGQVTNDNLLERYANRDFGKVFRAIEALGSVLAPVFAEVAEPFPPDMRKSNPSVSLGMCKRMKAMRGQGFTIKGIAREMGLDRGTVAAALKRATAG